MPLTTVQQLEALSAPLRRQMLESLRLAGPQSVADLSRRLGDAPTKLHYHAKVLAEAGLIVPYEVRPVRSRRETVYVRAADEFMIDAIGKPKPYLAALKRVAATMQHLALKDHNFALDHGLVSPANTWIWRGTAALNEDQLREVRRHLVELRAIFNEAEGTGSESLSLTVFLTPAIREP